MRVSQLNVKMPILLDVNSWEQLSRYNIFAADTQIDKIVFDFSDTIYVRPIGLIMAVALMKYSKNFNIGKRHFLRESTSRNVCSYLERMDFYHQFKIVRNNVNRNGQSARLCEIHEIKGENYLIAAHLKKIIESQVQIDPELSSAVTYSIGEVMDNIDAHSLSPINGYICAQTYENELEIAIVDCGIGMKESLRSYPAYEYITSDDEAIIKSTEKMVTSKPLEHHAGQGLFFTRRFIDANHGKLFIQSGNALVEFNNNADNPIINRVNYWKGTIVGMVFDLETPVHTKDIFDEEYPEDADIMLDGIFSESR